MSPNDNMPDSRQLEALVQQYFHDLSRAEKALLQAAPQGQLAVCGPSDDPCHPSNDPQCADLWGPDRCIRSDLLAWLCHDRQAKTLVHPKGLQILGALVVDALDISFTTIGFPLALARCRLRGELNLRGARTRTISLQGSRAHSILADGAIIDGALLIRDEFHSETKVLLTGAKIEGPLDCTGSRFDATGPGPALVADAIVVSGPVFLRNGFRANGEVRFPHSRIAADLDCSRGIFVARGASQFSTALTAEGAIVGGSVFLKNGFSAAGLVLLHGIQIEFNLDCLGGRIVNPAKQGVGGTGTTLNFDASIVKTSVMLQDGFHAEGLVSLIGTQIGGNLVCSNAHLDQAL